MSYRPRRGWPLWLSKRPDMHTTDYDTLRLHPPVADGTVRSTGDDDEGWHLMTPTATATDRSEEIRVALEATREQPDELSSLLRAYAQGGKSEQVAEASRSDLARLLALGRDRVPHPRHTAGPARAGDVVVAALRSQIRQLRAQDPRVRQELPEAVTRMRVATRQLRSVLHGFSRILDPEQTQPVADELKWLGAQLAEEHDTEVMIERFTQVIRALPENLIMGPLASDLERSLGQLAEQGEQTIMAALDSDRYLALQHKLDQLLEHPPLTRKAERPAQTELPKAVAKAFRKLDQQLDVFTALPAGPDRDNALHEARKTGKRVRYMTEVATPVIGSPARRLRKQTKKLQDLLGDYQDAVVARPILRQLAAAAHDEGHNAFTYGVLYALEHARMEHVLLELPVRLDRLREDRTLAWLNLKPAGEHDPTPIAPPRLSMAPQSPETALAG
jgi:CHAD domain-containing protein